MSKSKTKDIEKKNKKSDNTGDDSSTKNKSSKNENISKISTIINTLLVILTFVMILITYKANKISKNSVEVAQGALNQATRANDISEKNYLISFRSFLAADSINKANLKLTEQSVNAQIDALKESQKQFEKQNIPYLQLRNFKLMNFEENKKIEIFYWLQNLGSYPARIIDRKFGYFINSNTPPKNPYPFIPNLKHDSF